MKKALKVMMIMLMIFGIVLTALNFISVDNMAAIQNGAQGTLQSNGLCIGDPINC